MSRAGRTVAVGLVVASLGCARELRTPSNGPPAPAPAPPAVTEPGAGEEVVQLAHERCDSTPTARGEPSLIAIWVWGIHFWVVAPLTGETTMTRYFGPKWTLTGDATFEERTGRVRAGTREDKARALAQVEVVGQLRPGQGAGRGTDTEVFMPRSQQVRREVVLILDGDGGFFEKYRELWTCTNQALLRARRER